MDKYELKELLEEAYSSCMDEGDFDDEQLSMFIEKVIYLYDIQY